MGPGVVFAGGLGAAAVGTGGGWGERRRSSRGGRPCMAGHCRPAGRSCAHGRPCGCHQRQLSDRSGRTAPAWLQAADTGPGWAKDSGGPGAGARAAGPAGAAHKGHIIWPLHRLPSVDWPSSEAQRRAKTPLDAWLALPPVKQCAHPTRSAPRMAMLRRPLMHLQPTKPQTPPSMTGAHF